MTRIAFVMGDYPPEETKRREDVVRSHEGPALDIAIYKAEGSPYVRNLTPAHLELMSARYIEAFIRAEADGCDAIVPLGVLDIGVEAGRSTVSIPVVGPCEACLIIASQLGDRFGLLAYHPDMIGYQAAIIRRYSMEDRVVGWRTTGLHLPDIASQGSSLADDLEAQARSLIETEHADVIIPMGITQCPIHVDPRDLAQRIGVPVVDGIGAPIRMAVALADLGLNHSRRRWPLMDHNDR